MMGDSQHSKAKPQATQPLLRDLGQLDARGQGQGLGVDLRAAHDPGRGATFLLCK